MDPKFFFNRTDNDVGSKHFCNESDSNVPRKTAIRSYLLSVFVGSLSVLITCGNLLVITSIIYFKQLHTPTNSLILSLAVADLLVGVFLLPFSTGLSVGSCWFVRDLLCKVRGALDMFLCTSSILNLCFISVDRYYAVCHPLTYRTKITARVAVVMILVSWTVSALIGTGMMLHGLSPQHSNMRCSLFQIPNSAVIGAVLIFYIPTIIIFSVYLKIWMVAQRQAHRIQIATKSGAAVSKMERKATKTLAIVVGIFLMCWTPFFLYMTLHHSSTIPAALVETFKWLGWSNSSLNPFVYAFFYKWFRSAFRMIISGKLFHGDFSSSKLC